MLLSIGVLSLAACASAGVGARAPAVAPAVAAGTGGPDLQIVRDLPPPLDTENGSQQLVSANDLLQVTVFQVPDLNREAQVDSMGRITLPLIGSVPAAGKTLGQLQADLVRAYGSKYLQSPDITVAMKESAGQRVTVDGEIARAGIYPTTAQSTLLQVIAQAGGLTAIADADKIFVFRSLGSKRLAAQYSVAQIRQGRVVDPRVFGGDVVVVFASGSAIAIQNLKQALGLASSAVTLGVF